MALNEWPFIIIIMKIFISPEWVHPVAKQAKNNKLIYYYFPLINLFIINIKIELIIVVLKTKIKRCRDSLTLQSHRVF